MAIRFYEIKAAESQDALNTEWVKMFPDPESRPARHTQATPAGGRSLVQADFVAVLQSS